MPTYDYRCKACGHAFAKFQRMSDDPLRTCPECEAPELKRLIGAGAGIIFKGSGFYETDYKRSRSAPEGASDSKGSDKASGDSAGSGSGSDSGGGDSGGGTTGGGAAGGSDGGSAQGTAASKDSGSS